MGYNPLLPAPISAVQTTLSAIDLPNMHKFIQEYDMTALTNCEEEGVHLLMLLDSLDIALWTSLFVTATNDPNRTIANIKSAYARLNDLLMYDEQEAT